MTLLPQSRPLTREDFERVRDVDDGHRYELIDGVLIVTPSPRFQHQDVVGQLHLLLTRQCPPELKVVLAPFDVSLAADTVMQPDLLVTRRTDLTERELPVAPVLAIEVLSPSTRRLDLTLKRSRFEEAGVGAYWVVDPAGPELTAWHLEGGTFTEVAHVGAGETWRTDRPFPVEVVVSELRDLEL